MILKKSEQGLNATRMDNTSLEEQRDILDSVQVETRSVTEKVNEYERCHQQQTNDAQKTEKVETYMKARKPTSTSPQEDDEMKQVISSLLNVDEEPSEQKNKKKVMNVSDYYDRKMLFDRKNETYNNEKVIYEPDQDIQLRYCQDAKFKPSVKLVVKNAENEPAFLPARLVENEPSFLPAGLVENEPSFLPARLVENELSDSTPDEDIVVRGEQEDTSQARTEIVKLKHEVKLKSEGKGQPKMKNNLIQLVLANRVP